MFITKKGQVPSGPVKKYKDQLRKKVTQKILAALIVNVITFFFFIKHKCK